jgi:hypothetical protein
MSVSYSNPKETMITFLTLGGSDSCVLAGGKDMGASMMCLPLFSDVSTVDSGLELPLRFELVYSLVLRGFESIARKLRLATHTGRPRRKPYQDNQSVVRGRSRPKPTALAALSPACIEI